jgi:hypothetical protein
MLFSLTKVLLQHKYKIFIELSAGHLCRNSCIIEKAAGDRRQSHS